MTSTQELLSQARERAAFDRKIRAVISEMFTGGIARLAEFETSEDGLALHVTIPLDEYNLAPIRFTLEGHIAGWKLRTSYHGRAPSYDTPSFHTDIHEWMTGYIIYTQYHAECTRNGWYVRANIESARITTEPIEALTYAMEAWPAYRAAQMEAEERTQKK